MRREDRRSKFYEISDNLAGAATRLSAHKPIARDGQRWQGFGGDLRAAAFKPAAAILDGPCRRLTSI